MRMLSIATLGFFGCIAALAARGTALAQEAEPREELSGPQVYQTFCAVCHAPRGQGGPMGKSIVDPKSTAYTDLEIISIIEMGRPDLGMASYIGALSKTEIQGVTAHIRELQGQTQRALRNESAATAPAANASDIAKRGEELFNGKAACIQCHSYDYRGGVHGPDLSKIGADLTQDALREALVHPAAKIAEGYDAKIVVVSDGKKIEGRARNETEKSIQLLSEDGMIWTTYFKDRVKSVSDFPGSLMPSENFTRLSTEEQDALLAFLETLR